MAAHPYARDDTYLLEHFKQFSEACRRNVAVRGKSENDAKTQDRERDGVDRAAASKISTEAEMEKQKRKTYAIEKAMEMVHDMAQKGVDISPFISQDKEGNITMDWAGIAAASAKVKQSAPPPVDTKSVVDDIMAAGNAVQPGK